jgi:two-component system KDP operon response regulator KdpE
MAHVLIVEDDDKIAAPLVRTLEREGYTVERVAEGLVAIERVRDTGVDLVLLDLGLPDVEGSDLIPRLSDDAAIIVLSGRDDSQDKVAALDAGADDYLTKPFVNDELLARIRAIVRRSRQVHEEPKIFSVGKYAVDLDARLIRGPGDVRLTPTEWRLLESFLRQPGRLLAHRRLLTEIWGPHYSQEVGYLRQYVARLRQKLEVDPARPRHFLTESGLGYRFQR